MMIDQITPVLLTFNEAENIGRTLDRLKWARRIVVIDSGSTDNTQAIIRAYPQAEVIQRGFDDHASQWNFGNAQVSTEWILSLDADYELSDEFLNELINLNPIETTSGFSAKFIYRVFGHSLRGSLYPPRIVLYRKENSSYKNEGHTQRLIVNGKVLGLTSIIFHDDRKSLSRWFVSQQRYAHIESDYLLASDPGELSVVDRIRIGSWLAPLIVFPYVLLVKGCVLDGWPGWYYALQRVLAEILLALEILERRLSRGQGQTSLM